MRTLAAWVLARRINALVAIGSFTVVGLIFPPLIIVGLSLLGLVTLRKGGTEGLVAALSATLFLSVLAAAVKQQAWVDIVVLTLLIGSVWMLALLYRHMAQLAWAILGAGLIGLVFIVGFYAMVSEPEQFWLILLETYFRPAFVEARIVSDEADMDRLISSLSRVLTGGMAAVISVVLIVSLLIARWLQAALFNPGGFRKEFHALRLGRPAAIVMLVLVAASVWGKFPMTTDMATVVWLLFFFQGIAVVHGLIIQAGMRTGWLVGIYMLIMLVPHYASPVLSGLGFVDTWFDFRRRSGNK